MREDVKRLPLFGLGCVGGAAGIARLHDYLQAWPDHVAVLLSVELCSLTLQRDDSSLPNLVGGALFGDGAAAVVLTGSDHRAAAGPSVVATRRRLYPDSERVMGWDVGSGGFRIVLGADVPEVVRQYLGRRRAGFCATQGLTVPEIGTWVSHPGGPKVLEAVAETLELRPGALDLTWKSLDAVGNLSSSSVLHVLGDTLRLDPSGMGCCSRWARVSVPSSCCWSGDDVIGWYLVLVLLVGLERVAELVVSVRNAQWSFAQGGVEYGRGHYPFMVALHTGLLGACIVEASHRPFIPALGLDDGRGGDAGAGAAMVVHHAYSATSGTPA